MHITEAMKKKNWKLASGTWVAPVKESSKVAGILIEESTLGTGWTRVPSVPPNQAALVEGWKRFGLSDAEALIAAGVVKPSPKNELGDTPLGLLRKQLTSVRSNANLTD